jgi:hypothetical protein
MVFGKHYVEIDSSLAVYCMFCVPDPFIQELKNDILFVFLYDALMMVAEATETYR